MLYSGIREKSLTLLLLHFLLQNRQFLELYLINDIYALKFATNVDSVVLFPFSFLFINISLS